MPQDERLHNQRRLKALRRRLRNDPTPAEARLWQYLRKHQLDGRKFRRQHSIGPYIVDFYCPAERLAVELDGAVHADPLRRAYDAEREAFLDEHGIRVVRFENQQVVDCIDLVLDGIKRQFRA